MIRKRLGILINHEDVEKYTARFMVEYLINNLDNEIQMEDGYHIQALHRLDQLDPAILDSTDCLIDVFGYAIEWESYDNRLQTFGEIVDLNHMQPEDYLAEVVIYKGDLETTADHREFNFSVGKSEAYVSFIATEQELDAGFDFIIADLIQNFDLFEDNLKRIWFTHSIGKGGVTYEDVFSHIKSLMTSSDVIEKRFDNECKGNDRFRVSLAADVKFVKWLASLEA